MVVFDIVGAQAMFRRFYTNSSSLTYAFPPRPTLVGLIAGMMGIERGTYARLLDPEHLMIGVSLRSRIRTLIQTVNYVRTKAAGEFDGSAGGTQTPIEWVLPDGGERMIRYRVYVSHIDPEWLRTFDHMLSHQAWVYPPYLGMSECVAVAIRVAWIDSYKEIPAGSLVVCRTAVPAEALEELVQLSDGLELSRDRVPRHLDDDRRLMETGEVLIDRQGRPIIARFNRPAFVVKYLDPVSGEVLEEGGMFL